MNCKVFTYGTLMKGQSNHHYVRHCKYLGDAVLDDYGLKEVGYYPAAIPMEGFKVYGEIYEVDGKTKAEMDELEDVGVEYDCNTVIVHSKELGDIEVLFYEYIKDTSDMETRKSDGKWDLQRDPYQAEDL